MLFTNTYQISDYESINSAIIEKPKSDAQLANSLEQLEKSKFKGPENA
jgi:hypothetical protein